MAKQSIVILHGWTYNLKSVKKLKILLSQKYQVYLPIIPGFGRIKLKKAWDLNDYVIWLRNYVRRKRLHDLVIVAHSNGARIAIKYIAQGNKASKLILIAAAGLKTAGNIKKIIFYFIAKIGKLFFLCPILNHFNKPAKFILYSLVREKDYFFAQGFLKRTMQNLINEDISPQLKFIKIPTLILWGRLDKSTPINNAYIFKRNITSSKLTTYDKLSHNLPQEIPVEITNKIIEFLS